MKKSSYLFILMCLVLMFSTVTFAGTYNESPQLATKVAAGELPPVEKRLPLEPLVVELCDPYEGIGQYGGRLRLFKDEGHGSDWERFMHEAGVTFGVQADFASIYPNVFKDWEVNEDSTEFILYLREGMKFSDGHPLTTEDILFFWEDWQLNEDLRAAPRSDWVIDGEPAVFEAIDDYTLKVTFAGPYGIFLPLLATSRSGMRADPFMPKHYMKQFHADYVDVDELNAMAEAEGLMDWIELFSNRANWRYNSEIPTIHAWIIEGDRHDPARYARRNPYYFKVDAEGNQLPYIDELRVARLGNPEVAITQTLTGRYDLVARYITSMENRPLFQEAIDSGRLDMKISRAPSTNMNSGIILFNLTHEDPKLRELFNTPEFKIAVSHGINREDINDTLFWGMAEPRQAAPLAESAFAHEEYANAYLEFDPEKANQMLDELGMERDRHGWRTLPDGTPFRPVFINAEHNHFTDLVEMLVAQMRENLGIDIQQRAMEWRGYRNTSESNQHDISLWHGDGGVEVLFDPRMYIPSSSFSTYATQWRIWRDTHGESGEEPPETWKQLIAYYDEGALQTAVLEEQQAYIKKILDHHLVNLPIVGTLSVPDGYALTSGNLRNVPDWFWNSWVDPYPANAKFETFYFVD